jgi:hypothetical protein
MSASGKESARRPEDSRKIDRNWPGIFGKRNGKIRVRTRVSFGAPVADPKAMARISTENAANQARSEAE